MRAARHAGGALGRWRGLAVRRRAAGRVPALAGARPPGRWGLVSVRVDSLGGALFAGAGRCRGLTGLPAGRLTQWGRPRCAASPHAALGRASLHCPGLVAAAPLPCSRRTTAWLLSTHGERPARRRLAALTKPWAGRRRGGARGGGDRAGRRAARRAARRGRGAARAAGVRGAGAARGAAAPAQQPVRHGRRGRLGGDSVRAGSALISNLLDGQHLQASADVARPQWRGRIGVAAGAQRYVSPQCLAAWHARRDNPPLARGCAAASASAWCAAGRACCSSRGRWRRPSRWTWTPRRSRRAWRRCARCASPKLGYILGGSLCGGDPLSRPDRLPTVQNAGQHPCWPWTHTQPQRLFGERRTGQPGLGGARTPPVREPRRARRPG